MPAGNSACTRKSTQRTTTTIKTSSRPTIQPTPTSKQPPPLQFTNAFKSLATIDKQAIREWRQAHPKRYHPPSIASGASVRSAARSVIPKQDLRHAGASSHAAETGVFHRRNASQMNSTAAHNPLLEPPTVGGLPVHTLKQKRHN